MTNLCNHPDGCDRAVLRVRSGLCGMHYQRVRYGKKPMVLIEDRVRAQVEAGDPAACIEWEGGRTPAGYGRAGYKGRKRVHRISFELFVGPIPDGHVVRHKCDNPPCINPGHLETGTQRDNMRDVKLRGTKRSVSDEMAHEIDTAYRAGGVTYAQLARHYGTTRIIVGNICRHSGGYEFLERMVS